MDLQEQVAWDGALMLDFPVIDKYLYSTEDWVVAEAPSAIGLVTCGVRNESEPALALLRDYVESEKVMLKTAAIVGYINEEVNA
jgi:hypothetical protein